MLKLQWIPYVQSALFKNKETEVLLKKEDDQKKQRVHLVEFGAVLSGLLVPGDRGVSGSGQTLEVRAVSLSNYHQPLLRLHLQPG